MGIIYSYKNKVNNKRYIGQTVNPIHRQIQHKSVAFNELDASYDTPFHRAIRKYGWDSFEYEELAQNDNIDELNELEIYYIQLYNSQIPNGYNIEAGGKNAPKPKDAEWRKKLTWAQAKLTEEEVIELRLAYQNHESPTQIYKEKYEDRLHFNSFLNIWTGARYKNIMPEVFSEEKRHTKLNEDTVRNIKQDRRDLNLTYAQLSEKYNISKSTIADIIKERTWKRVTI